MFYWDSVCRFLLVEFFFRFLLCGITIYSLYSINAKRLMRRCTSCYFCVYFTVSIVSTLLIRMYECVCLLLVYVIFELLLSRDGRIFMRSTWNVNFKKRERECVWWQEVNSIQCSILFSLRFKCTWRYSLPLSYKFSDRQII